MEIKIGDHINYIAEERALLIGLTQPDQYPQGFLQTQENVEKSLSNPALNRRLAVVDKIVKEAQKAFKKDMEQVEKYFRLYSNKMLCLADAVILFEMWDWNETAQTLEDYVQKQTPPERAFRFRTLDIETLNDNNEDTAEAVSLGQISRWLDQTSLEPEDKWQIFSAFVSWEEHLTPIVQLMKKAEKVLEKTRTLWAPVIEEFHDYWTRQCRERDVLEDIKNIYQIDLRENSSRDIVWAPSLISTNQMSFSVPDKDKRVLYEYYSIGIIFGDGFYLDFEHGKNEKWQMNECLQFFKLLSDKSKLEIMMSIKDQPAYGAQLSRQMNLTTATISYHMSALIQNGLVSVQRKENRIYYSMHKDKVKKIIQYIENVLL